MYGVIFLWRVKPDKLVEHQSVVKATLYAERTRCPEVLLNLTFGPANDGTCAEIQIYADETTSRAFSERVKREDSELQKLWSRYRDICDPDGWKTLRFDNIDFLNESFVRAAAGVGFVAI